MIALRIAAVLAVLIALVGVALVVARPSSGSLGASMFVGGAVAFALVRVVSGYKSS